MLHLSLKFPLLFAFFTKRDPSKFILRGVPYRFIFYNFAAISYIKDTGKRADFRRLSFPFSRTSTVFEGGGVCGSKRFAHELYDNKKARRKLNSPVGCSQGRAAKGANPVASTKTPRRHFCRLGVFAVVRGLNHSRRNVWKCDALFSAVGPRERTPAAAKPLSLS